MSDTGERFTRVLNEKLGIPGDEATAEVTFDALGLDSLALIELSVAVQKEFGVVLEETELTPEHTVGSVVEVLSRKAVAA